VPLLARYGVSCSLEEFQETINVVFHDMEAEVYDEVHRDMWLSLPRQFELLTSDVLPLVPERDLVALDIGCGTGLSSKQLLSTALGRRVTHLHLVDTSSRMLERFGKLPTGIHTELTEGLISDLPQTGAFDVILACSVLHHIPDLEVFARDVRRLQRPGGFFLHLQDPNADSAGSAEGRVRYDAYQRYCQSRLPNGLSRMTTRLASGLWSRVTGRQKTTYLDRVNDELIRRGIIDRAMDPPDIWATTDIHIGSGKGISLAALAGYLPEYKLISKRSYGFFSELSSSLPQDMCTQENALIDSRSQDGCYVAAAWQLTK
jgi:SAM-dependent methyltransferase